MVPNPVVNPVVNSVLNTPLAIGGTTVKNRLYRAPVLEGAGDGDDAPDRYARHFVENARHGVGLIIQGSACIAPEGRTSPGMTCVDTEAKVMRLAPMVRAVQQAGAKIFLQLGHGGLYGMEAWHEPYASARRYPIVAASPLPWYLKAVYRGVDLHVLTTAEVYDLATRCGQIAAWARNAGYDGVQLGSANAKLFDQFLSPFYNRRTDAFGGSFENRARILRLIREAVAERAGADFACTVKAPAEVAPLGLPRSTPTEALELCRLVQEWGYDAVTPVEVSVLPDTTLSRGGVPDSLWTNPGMRKRLRAAAPDRSRRAVLIGGSWWGGKTAPFEPQWNRFLFSRATALLDIPVFAVGGIRTGAEVNEILDRGEADMVGIGRPFYAEPDVARRILDDPDDGGRCQNSNRCVPAQMLGMKGVCYNPDVRKVHVGRHAAPEESDA